LTHRAGVKILDQLRSDPSIDEEEVDAVEWALDEIFDREARRDYGIKKPPVAAIRSAIADLLEAKGSDFETSDLVDLLINENPTLQAE
jgi:hypothetical protein